MLSTIGLVIIVVGWIWQLVSVCKTNNQIQKNFLALYAIGVVLLVVDGFMADLISLAIPNAICLIAVLAILFCMKERQV